MGGAGADDFDVGEAEPDRVDPDQHLLRSRFRKRKLLLPELFHAGSVEPPGGVGLRQPGRTEAALPEQRHDHVGSVGGDGVDVEFGDRIELFGVVDRADVHFDSHFVEPLHRFGVDRMAPDAEAVQVIINVRFGPVEVFKSESLDPEGGFFLMEQFQQIRVEAQYNGAVLQSAAADFVEHRQCATFVVRFEFDQNFEGGTSSGDRVERLLKRGDARSGEFRPLPGTEVECAQLFEAVFDHRTAAVAAPVDVGIVSDHQSAVAGRVDVELQRVDAGVDGGEKGGDGVFRIARPHSAVSDNFKKSRHETVLSVSE